MTGPWQIYCKITPLAASGMLSRDLVWNDLMSPLVVNTDPEKMPPSAGFANLKGEYLTDYPVADGHRASDRRIPHLS
ncbi:hypothetical protein HGP14_33450 [Rhizobium sp. P32RR-XVIII]|uniref:hypothetical protein n=1 Tax=Rhizobium sp. P32RR-XVIII TaxID=2726738 RepID=UPI0014572695|nr:hypothetical protein [Rhizobium sp. P32RR-XVIII]NLS08104.1 hypothetical protein [Rhizobium sp. P32RR-XVIII]